MGNWRLGQDRLNLKMERVETTPPVPLVLPKMIRIPGGTFDMGSKKGESNEEPVHQVTVSDFWLGETEVTVRQFASFVSATRYKTDAEKGDGSYILTGSSYEKKAGVNWRCDVKGTVRPESEWNHPVIHVSWNDAKAYCDWLSAQTGQRWRLPTEAEWEYAAGGGSGRRTEYAGTDDVKRLRDYAWYDDNSDNQTHPVGEKRANGLGLYDMSGNVWEWCSDWYGETYYQTCFNQGTVFNPENTNSESSRRVLRGGSWDFDSYNCRVADRSWNNPDVRYNDDGFRVARD